MPMNRCVPGAPPQSNSRKGKPMNHKKWLSAVFAFACIAFLSGGGGVSYSPMTAAQSGTVFVTGTDAPLPSVVSFQVDITGITVTEGKNTQSVLSGTQTVGFARLNGMRTLLDNNTIPDGKYTRV